jgi:Na+-transporting methylmalonyl-CoA/oxaloacetate decarboxylase gamma subunit
VWLGSALSLGAFALLAYAFLLWSRFNLWREIWRWLMVAGAGLIFLVLVGKQIVSQYRLENPTVQTFDLHLSTSWLIAPLGLCVLLIVLGLLWITRQISGKERTTADADEKARKEEELKQLSEALEKQTTETNKANEQYLEIVTQKQGIEDALIQSRAMIGNLEQKLNVVQCKADDLRDQLASHAPLLKTAVDDKAAIEDLVMVCSIEPRTEKDKGPLHLEFRWVFLNMALYEVSVLSIAGFITFHKNGAVKGIPFRIAPTLENNEAARNRAFRKEGCFIIQQDFQSSLEADEVLNSSPDTYYDFSNLIVTLTGDGFETRLNTNYRVKKNEQWLPRGNCDFIYACLAERDAKIAKLEAALGSAT